MANALTSTALNVLMIAVDDLRPQAGGAYLQDYMKTPNLDRLSAEGVTFERAYTQIAVCSPSRTSLLTGLRPDFARIWTIGPYFREQMGALGSQVITLPQHFRENGYRVTGAGKVFHPGTSSGGPSKGEGGGDGGYPFKTNGSWSEPYFFCDQFYNGTFQSPAMQSWPAGRGCVQSEACLSCLGSTVGSGKPFMSYADCPSDCYPDGAVADEIVRQIKDRASSSGDADPFFIAAGLKRPHLGWFAPKKYFDMYVDTRSNSTNVAPASQWFPPEKMPPIAFGNDDGAKGNGEVCGMDGVDCYYNQTTGFQLVNRSQHAILRAAYYSAVSFMDSQLGRILDALDETGLRDTTAVVLWGDHGYALGEHGLWCKTTNFELSTRVPLIFSPPKSASGFRKNASEVQIASLLDVYPTLVDLAGLPQPGGPYPLQGKSLAPFLRTAMNGEVSDDPIQASSFSQYPRSKKGSSNIMGVSVRTDSYRYTEWVEFNYTSAQPVWDKPVEGAELYVHAAGAATADYNRWENKNLASDPSHAKIVADHAALLRKYWDSKGDAV